MHSPNGSKFLGMLLEQSDRHFWMVQPVGCNIFSHLFTFTPFVPEIIEKFKIELIWIIDEWTI